MKSKIEVRIICDPPMKWPLWFSDDVFDSEEKAPLSQSLKCEGRRLNQYVVQNSSWVSLDDQYQWKTPRNREEFNLLMIAFEKRLGLELGDAYRVIGQYSRKNASNYIQLLLKHPNLHLRLRQFLTSR
jgi:hypothetical protein